MTYNILLSAYGQFVGIDAAYSVIHRMEEAEISPDLITYNSLIAATTKSCLLSRTLDLFEEMLRMGIQPDMWSYNSLMHCFFKLGKPDAANRVFLDNILTNLLPSSSTFSIMINDLCNNGYIGHALSLYRYF